MARATMAGDDVTAIVTDKFVGERISAFTLDYRKKRIYFIDYDTVRVSRIFGSDDPRFESDGKHTFLFEWFGHPITAAIYQIGYNNKPDQKPKVIRPRLVSACLSLAVQSESNLKPKQSKTI